ncbi:MAG: hypothetical protein V7K21_08800 [Nostoc sp.]|uniref:hypothetical protein n=1 Tax=Nostoc sp. TaxID=1180 RepID=UPI002FF9EBD6
MKGFKKLSSIALLLCAFVYPSSLVEAKDISLSNVHNEQSAAPEANLVGNKTGELLIARRWLRPHKSFRRRQIIRRRERSRGYENFRRREPSRGYENFRRREPSRGYKNFRRRY